MYLGLRDLTAPSVSPVKLERARRHCRIDHHDDDDLLGGYLAAATSMMEAWLNRALITRTLRFTLADDLRQPPADMLMLPRFAGGWPFGVWPLSGLPPISLPRSPVVSVQSVTVRGPDGSDSVLAPSDYTLDTGLEPARLRLKPGTLSGPLTHVQVDYTAGYGTSPDAVPAPIVVGLLWLTAFLYENRGDVAADMPEAIVNIVGSYRTSILGLG